MACYRSAVKHVPWPRWTRPQKRGIGGFPADGEEHGGRTLTVCPAGWRRGIVYRYCRDLERGKGEGLADNGLVPRLLISWRRCVPSSSSFFPLPRIVQHPASIKWAGNACVLSWLPLRRNKGFFADFHLARSVVWSMGGGFGTRAWRGSEEIDGYARVPHEVERRCDYWAEFLIWNVYFWVEFYSYCWNKIWRKSA